MDKITIKKFLEKHEYTIKDDGVSYLTSTLTNSKEGFIAFDDLGSRINIHVKRDSTYLILGVGGFFFGLFALVSSLTKTLEETGDLDWFGVVISAIIFIGSLILSGFYFMNLKGGTYLKNSSNQITLIFPATFKRQSDINNFTDKLIRRRNEFLLSKYQRLIKSYPHKNQKINTWQWLNNEKVITDIEFVEKMERLNNPGNIGFSSN